MSSAIFASVRQQLGDVHAALAVLRELERRPDAEQILLPAGHAGDALALADAVGQVLAGHLGELRLRIEQIEVRRRAGHEQVDDALRLRREVQALAARRAPPGHRRLQPKRFGLNSEVSASAPRPVVLCLQERAAGEGRKHGGAECNRTRRRF